MTTQVAPAEPLGPSDAAVQHAFAHPDHVQVDRAVLCMLIRDFQRHLSVASSSDAVMTYVPNAEHWHRRIVIPDPRAFDAIDRIAVVGFFGRMRDQVDDEVAARIKSLGRRLVDAVLTTEGVLGYSTHLLADERNYANLVLLTSADIMERWRATAPHPAAGDASPHYYEYVRIYNGSVAVSDLSVERAITLERVKYWDYRSSPVWHAVRTLN